MRGVNNKIGFKVKTKYGWEGVVSSFCNGRYSVLWQDGEITSGHTWDDVKSSRMKPRNQPIICGKGFIGKGEYITSERYRKNDKELVLVGGEYLLWVSMLKRVYSDCTNRQTDAYLNATCYEGWHNLQEFSKWCNLNKWFNAKDDKGIKYELDKDILKAGNKRYCPELCVFIPKEINNFITPKRRGVKLPENRFGSYKSGKTFQSQCSNPFTGKLESLGRFATPELAEEAFFKKKNEIAKELADKWVGRVDERVIYTLSNMNSREYYYVQE